jgi:hypothetical protein
LADEFAGVTISILPPQKAWLWHDAPEKLRLQISRLAEAVAEHGHSPALLEKLTGLETQEYELKEELTHIDLLLQAKPEPISERRLQKSTEKIAKILPSGTSDEQRQALSGWIHNLAVERIDKRNMLVRLEIYIPPKSDHSPPRRNIGLRVAPPPWGHLSIDLYFEFQVVRKKYTHDKPGNFFLQEA